MRLTGPRLFSGLYVNELLVRLVMFQESIPALYRSYQEAIVALSGERDLHSILRKFELSLLDALGYGINLQCDCYSGEPITEHGHYLFHPDVGFEKLLAFAPGSRSNSAVFSGGELVALREEEVESMVHSQAARRLTRIALQVHLGDKPLASRALFARANTPD